MHKKFVALLLLTFLINNLPSSLEVDIFIFSALGPIMLLDHSAYWPPN